MKKEVLLISFLVIVLFIISCKETDISQLSNNNSDIILEKNIECNPPYLISGTECCLDLNNNTICDQQEIESNDEEISSEIDTITEQSIGEKSKKPKEFKCPKNFEEFKETFAENEVKKLNEQTNHYLQLVWESYIVEYKSCKLKNNNENQFKCLRNSAQDLRNYCICEEINEDKSRSSCYAYIGRRLNSIEICNKSTVEEDKIACSDFVYNNLAYTNVDISYCDKISAQESKDKCYDNTYNQLAIVKKDVSFCDKIIEVGKKDSCYNMLVGKFEEVDACNCAKIEDKMSDQSCFYSAAIKRVNVSLCVLSGGWATTCYNNFGLGFPKYFPFLQDYVCSKSTLDKYPYCHIDDQSCESVSITGYTNDQKISISLNFNEPIKFTMKNCDAYIPKVPQQGSNYVLCSYAGEPYFEREFRIYYPASNTNKDGKMYLSKEMITLAATSVYPALPQPIEFIPYLKRVELKKQEIADICINGKPPQSKTYGCQLDQAGYQNYLKDKDLIYTGSGIDRTSEIGQVWEISKFSSSEDKFEETVNLVLDIFLNEDLTMFNFDKNALSPSFIIEMDNMEYNFRKYGNEYKQYPRFKQSFTIYPSPLRIEKSEISSS